jgi:hypothetical protein
MGADEAALGFEGVESTWDLKGFADVDRPQTWVLKVVQEEMHTWRLHVVSRGLRVDGT